jgi:3-oxoacyl-[acyl-carrier protein] reductase
MTVKDKIALVTGSARGLGRAIAEKLAERGAKIVISDILEELAAGTAEELRQKGYETLAVPADVTKIEDVKKLVDKTVEHFGSLDILVNNAGVTKDALILRMKEADWDFVLTVNLKGAYLVTQAAAKVMFKKRSGRIINISSVVGRMGNIGQANYVSSKAGLIGLTKATARELAPRNITVNAVAPGFINTEMTENLPEAVREEFNRSTALKRFGEPEDIANTVAFLASDDAAYITGQVVPVDGGLTMY